jgi:hypothetical protein
MACGAASVLAYAFPDIAAAQTSASGETIATTEQLTPPERLERARTFLTERAETRPRQLPPPIGLPPAGIVEPPVDWALAGRLVQLARRSDAARLDTTRAVTTVPRVSSVDGGQAGLRTLDGTRLPRLAPAEVDRVNIPVLAPATSEIAASIRLVGQDGAYTAVATAADGVALRISGARKKIVLPARATPRERLKRMRAQRSALPSIDATYLITRSENSTDLSFSKFGVGYVLSVICDEPDDARCLEDDYITALAKQMVLLNPERIGEGQ